MVEFTFKGLFMTTNKGIPDISNLPSSTTLAKPFYVYSVLLQSILLLFFIFYFALSVFRVYKKIKNSKFEDVIDHEETAKNMTERNVGDNENEKEEKLVYQFDDQQQQEQKEKEEVDENGDAVEKSQKLDKSQKKEDQKVEENYDDYHDEHEQAFIQLDNKLLFFQPFLISFIVCNGVFAADPFTLILLLLTLVSYIAFNIKRKWESFKFAPFLFMVFSFLAFISFFYNDHDLTT